jgi:ElaB/YqjD/DUF883 family membrane-anchored ribosome-binding protein
MSDVKDQVTETARSYASSAAEYADEATEAVRAGSRRVADQARETADYLAREQPWAVAVAGVLAGAAVATLFPSTRIERRTLGEVGERLRSAAGTAGEQIMEAGMKAGERLNEVAKERGLTREGLKDAARDVGETFSSALGGDASQTSNESRTQTRQAQSGDRTGEASKAPGSSSSGATPSGGRR